MMYLQDKFFFVVGKFAFNFTDLTIKFVFEEKSFFSQDLLIISIIHSNKEELIKELANMFRLLEKRRVDYLWLKSHCFVSKKNEKINFYD